MAEARLFVRGSELWNWNWIYHDRRKQTEKNYVETGCKLRLVQPHSGWTTRGRRCNPTCANRRCCGSAACDSAAARLPAQRRGRLRLPSSHARAARSGNCRAALHTMSHGLIWYSIPSLQGANPDLHDLSMSPMPPAFLSCAVVFDPSVPQFLNCVVLVKWSPSIA